MSSHLAGSRFLTSDCSRTSSLMPGNFMPLTSLAKHGGLTCCTVYKESDSAKLGCSAAEGDEHNSIKARDLVSRQASRGSK